MSGEESTPEVVAEKPKRAEGQVTLAQMLKVLDKDVATGVEKKLKKLSKKKGYKAVVNDQEIAKSNRKAAYEDAVQLVSKWEPIVEHNRRGNLSFPLDVQADNLPTTADSLSNIEAKNDLEKEILHLINEDMSVLAKKRDERKTEELYKKAISAEEAKERHLELQKTRVRLNEFASKMRRQNKIKSKSYHRLLKQERTKKHIKRVESDKDALMVEIDRLQKIRALERATLKHKNTGKWAKHAKFRAKYDEEARKLMLDQIGIASKRLEKPAMPDSDSDSEDDDNSDDGDEDDDDDDDVSDSIEGEEEDSSENNVNVTLEGGEDGQKGANDRLIISSDLVGDSTNNRKRNKTLECEQLSDSESDDDDGDEQRKLMSEAFANDDVVGEFQKTKERVADEEQPKGVNTFLPGWNEWAGPGLVVNARKRAKFVRESKKINRKDEALSNVIISEHANDSIKAMQPKSLPRNQKSILSKPVTASFTDQASFRESIRPKIVTKMGVRIEPINKRVLTSGGKATWA